MSIFKRSGEQGTFEGKRLIHPQRLLVFLKQQKFIFLVNFQSCQILFVYMERALLKRDSGVARIAPYDLPILKRRDHEDRGDLGREFRGFQSYGRALRREAQVSRLKDEFLTSSCHSIET